MYFQIVQDTTSVSALLQLFIIWHLFLSIGFDHLSPVFGICLWLFSSKLSSSQVLLDLLDFVGAKFTFLEVQQQLIYLLLFVIWSVKKLKTPSKSCKHDVHCEIVGGGVFNPKNLKTQKTQYYQLCGIPVLFFLGFFEHFWGNFFKVLVVFLHTVMLL